MVWVFFGSHAGLRAEVQNPSTDAWISHQGDLVVVEVNGKRTNFLLAELKDGSAKFSVKLGKNETAFLRIKDPNPLLFSYGLGKRTEVENAEYKNLKEFAEGWKKAFGVVGSTTKELHAASAATATGLVAVSVGGARVTKADIRAVDDLVDLFKEIDPILQQSVGATGLAASQRLGMIEDKTKPFEGKWAEISGSINRVVTLVFALELAAIDKSVIDVSYYKSAILTPKILSFTEIFSEKPVDDSDSQADLKNLRSLYEARNRLKGIRDLVESLATRLEKFRQVAVEGFTVGRVKGDWTKDITQEVAISAIDAGGGGATVKTHQDSHTGTLSAVVSPRQWLHFRPGLGVVYSFVKNPEFSAEKQADGTFTINQKTNNYNEFSGAVTGNFIPDRYFDQTFEPFVQLGYSQQDDAKGLMLGLGFLAYEKFNLSGGIIYQEAKQLGNGQALGGKLTNAEDLKVEKKFKSGLYIQVGVRF